MKTNELNQCNLMELDSTELVETEGGNFFDDVKNFIDGVERIIDEWFGH